MPVPFERRLWAKDRGLAHPYPAGCHAIDAAVMAGALWDRYLTPRQRRVIAEGWGLADHEARLFVVTLAGLHDLGKITPGFQACAPERIRSRACPATSLPRPEADCRATRGQPTSRSRNCSTAFTGCR
ncbi:HD domain-containing protein [Streptomyces sp. NPDC046876]|uniref:HD domain-containing protein n=1 Tax=Streptomyces sp. NPDC046876 TaxID=3155616 RepID=UPI0033DBBCF9